MPDAEDANAAYDEAANSRNPTYALGNNQLENCTMETTHVV